MSEEILRALTQLFAIISKQDEGVTEIERNFIISFYQQELDTETVNEYLSLYDGFAEYGFDYEAGKTESLKEEQKKRVTKVNDSVKVLKLCRQINKTLSQKQKVIVLFKILEMVASDRHFTRQRMDIINTVSETFNVPKLEYSIIKSFVTEEHSFAILDSDEILVFDDEKPPEGSKRKHIDSGLLDGEILFVRVKSVDLHFIRYTGKDDIFLNGKLVHQNAILLFSHGSIIKTPKGAPLYYSDLVSRYNSDTDRANISFNVDNLEFRFPNGAVGLRNVNLSETTGKLIGIMGASGAGKTTMLNVLAGLEIPYGGKVLINGFDIHDKEEKTHIEGVIGYIAQDDLLIEELTVFQNLFYNAKLCFKDLSDIEITKRVEDVLASLGLDRIMHLKVGSVLNKKISGGQRKRLNIALELIREPLVLFVDEPTSGLSSRDSENVIDLLKELSLKGKLIFVVIHQPSSDIYKMFDKMYILDTGGYPAFYGNPVEAVTYFKRSTRQVGSERGQCMTCGNVTPEQIFNLIESRVVDEYGEFTNKRKITPDEWHQMYQTNFKIERKDDIKEEPPKNLKIPTQTKQTLIFTVRDFLSKIANRQYMVINLLEAPALALLMALVIRYKEMASGGNYFFRNNDNIPAYILICIIIALFMGLTVSAEEIIRDRKILKRESFLNLSRNSYLFSKVIILFSFSAIQTMTFVLIGNTILDIKDMTLMYWLMLFSVSCFANVLGLNISSSFDSAVTVYILIPLLLIPQMILSGGIFNFDKMNNAIADRGKVPIIADILVSRWAYEGIIVEQFRSNRYEKTLFRLDTESSIANYKTSFWLPELEDVINRCVEFKKSGTKKDLEKMRKDLILISNEFKNEPFKRGIQSLGLQALSPESFDEVKAEQFREYIEKIKNYYFKKNEIASDSITLLKSSYQQNKKASISLNDLMNNYHNESLADYVTNVNVKEKFVYTWDSTRIVQVSDPVFNVPKPKGWLDYRTHFFAAKKHFGGRFYNTYHFNVTIIWLMTLFLYFTLYFDVLRKAINLGSKIKLFKK